MDVRSAGLEATLLEIVFGGRYVVVVWVYRLCVVLLWLVCLSKSLSVCVCVCVCGDCWYWISLSFAKCLAVQKIYLVQHWHNIRSFSLHVCPFFYHLFCLREKGSDCEREKEEKGTERVRESERVREWKGPLPSSSVLEFNMQLFIGKQSCLPAWILTAIYLLAALIRSGQGVLFITGNPGHFSLLFIILIYFSAIKSPKWWIRTVFRAFSGLTENDAPSNLSGHLDF